MAFETHTYDPAQVILNYDGKDITGFADGTFLGIEFNADAFTLVVGADGESTRAKSNNRSGRVTFTLQQASLSNDVLNAIAEADRLSNSGARKLMVKDAGGGTLAQATAAWIVRKPKSEFAKEAENREWILETGNLDYNLGGNPVL